MIIRGMTPGDLPEVGVMLAECFPVSLVRYLTYAQHGVSAFLEMQLTHQHLSPGSFYRVAVDAQDRAVAFAEFKMVAPRTGFLSYLCVDRHARGKGVATSLMREFVDHRDLERVDLDVFEDNAPAVRLYTKLGFVEQGQNVWLRRPLPAPTIPLSLFDFPSSAAAYAAYGFCELRPQSANPALRLGRIGSRVLRCFDVSSFNDDSLLSRAKATLPDLTEVLFVAPPGSIQAVGAGAETVAVGRRMTLGLGALGQAKS